MRTSFRFGRLVSPDWLVAVLFLICIIGLSHTAQKRVDRVEIAPSGDGSAVRLWLGICQKLRQAIQYAQNTRRVTARAFF